MVLLDKIYAELKQQNIDLKMSFYESHHIIYFISMTLADYKLTW